MDEVKNAHGKSETLVSRRSVVRAAAWSAPVVAMSVAVPAASASAYSVSSTSVTLSITKPVWPEFVPLFTQTPTLSGGATTIDFKSPASNWFTVGQNINISNSGVTGYNGSFPVTAVTGTKVTFTNATAATALSISPKAISSFSLSGSAMTVNANGHGFSAGQLVDLGGAASANLNGTWKVKTVATNSFTITIPTGVTVTNTLASYTLSASVANTAASGSVPALNTISTSLDHGLTAGQVINISGATGTTSFNANWVVYDVPTTKTFRIATSITGNSTSLTSATLKTAYAVGAGAVSTTPVMYSWMGASSYQASFITINDPTGPFPWPISDGIYATYTFRLPTVAEGNPNVSNPSSMQIWKLDSGDTTTARLAGATAPAGASEIVEGDILTADDGGVWTVNTYDKTSNPNAPSVVLQSTPRSVTSGTQVFYVPRVGLKATNVIAFTKLITPFVLDFKFEVTPAGKKISNTASNAF